MASAPAPARARRWDERTEVAMDSYRGVKRTPYGGGTKVYAARTACQRRSPPSRLCLFLRRLTHRLCWRGLGTVMRLLSTTLSTQTRDRFGPTGARSSMAARHGAGKSRAGRSRTGRRWVWSLHHAVQRSSAALQAPPLVFTASRTGTFRTATRYRSKCHNSRRLRFTSVGISFPSSLCSLNFMKDLIFNWSAFPSRACRS